VHPVGSYFTDIVKNVTFYIQQQKVEGIDETCRTIRCIF